MLNTFMASFLSGSPATWIESSSALSGKSQRCLDSRAMYMKLRTQIFLFLFLFGLVPLLSVVVINVPLIFDRIESLYYKSYLQNLRAEFADLDQHIVRRHEMVRLLAKMPEPGMMQVSISPGR